MTDFKKVTTKTKFSEFQVYSVEKIKGDQVELKNESGESIVVDKGYVENCLVSADQFTKEEVVNKTRAAEIFLSNPEVVMTVSFQKQTKEADVVAEIKEAYENSTPKEFETKLKKAVKTGLNGVERTLVGFHKGNVDEFGRVHITDLEIAPDTSKSYDVRQRLVDPRTINSLVVKGVKYTVK